MRFHRICRVRAFGASASACASARLAEARPSFARAKAGRLAVLLMCIAGPALAQGNPTGTIAGRITDAQGGVLPGVTVTASSPTFQGSRTTVTSEHGDYLLAFLTPGEYVVTIELDGFERATKDVRVAAAQTVPVNVQLQLAGAVFKVDVTAPATETIPRTSTGAMTLKHDVIGALPLPRDLNGTVALAPGVQRTGITSRTSGLGLVSISGATTFDSLFLLDGVVVNENLRGQAISLFIEDAIQETSVSTSGVSAEFGRFSGGVVNAVTKSGGNDFSGTFRTTFGNDNWRSRTPFNETKSDVTVPTYEYTFGGPVFRDRLWFFNAGRFVEETSARQTVVTLIPYERVSDEKRYEGKLTYTLMPGHTVRGGYITRRTVTDNESNQFPILDLAGLNHREDTDSLLSLNYNGIYGRMFLEGQYSRREGTSAGNGSRYTDLVRGTLLIDRQRGNARYNSATFCGVCRPEERDNENLLLKGSYFLSTAGWGSHNLVFGYDTFTDVRAADNYQSGSNYRIIGTSSIITGDEVFPVFNNDGRSTVLQWNPIYVNTQGTDFRTHSFFANDVWQLNTRFSFNAGLRYDANRAVDAAGNDVSRDSKLSPRLGVTWDPNGRGDWTVNGSYSVYVSALNNTIANSASIAGNSASYQFAYLGPAINTNPNAPLLTREQAIQTVFEWFNANGGTSRAPLSTSLPGVNVRIGDDLASPSANELAGGVTRRLGERGMVRVDGVYRDFSDLYATRVDMATGRVTVNPTTLEETTGAGSTFDVRIVENASDLERQYAALNTSLTWRFGKRLDLGAGYTLSRVRGNFDGENEASGPLSVTPRLYPEYREERWNYPTGDLIGDERHKARVWGTWLVPMNERFGSVNLGALFSADSGMPYGAAGPIDPSVFTPNPGYVTPLTETAYYFTARDAFRSQASTRTDLAVNYDYRFRGVRHVTLFVKAEVLNLFDQSKLVNRFFLDQTVLTASNNAARYQRFNPFTETPVQGTHWDFGPRFGQATNRFAHQPPRQFRFALGVRF